jgi:elongation factor 1-beta
VPAPEYTLKPAGAAAPSGKPAGKKAAEQKKPAEKKGGADDDFDLFGDSDAAPKKETTKPAAPAAKGKKAVIAKSIVVFDVKVFEQEQDLDALANKIFEMNIDGLVWNKDYKKVPVAFGMNKLQIGCVIEDDKVATDDIFDKILAWEDEIQSCDIETFQKL